MPAPIRTDPSPIDFGAQGGDPRRGVDMDLSTWVNRYGPAPAAITALHAIEPADILLHRYEAAATHCAVPRGDRCARRIDDRRSRRQ